MSSTPTHSIDISHALTIQGWMEPAELQWLAETASRCHDNIAEIGSYKGRSICAIAAHTSATVFAVDIWSECGTDGWYYDVFRRNTAHLKNVIPINRASIWAAREFAAQGKRFSLIFIDGSHDQHNVRQDILAWRPLLAEGGTLCGHDYGFAGWPDVKRVVDELVGPVGTCATIWYAL